MSEAVYRLKSNQVEVKPRRMSFPFSKVKTKFFFKDNALLSTFFTALSSTFPAGEAEFIESVRLYRDKVNNNVLLEQIKGFIGQEGHHSYQHKRINEHLRTLGLDAVKLENHLERDIKRMVSDGRRSNPKVRLAITVAMEHLTAIMAEHMLTNPEVLDSLDSSVQDLLFWHAVEEIEHKAVAFDVYKECEGSEKTLHGAMRIGTVMFVARLSAYMVALLWWTRTVPSFKDIREFYSFMFGDKGLISSIRKPYMQFFKPGFHPWDRDDSHLIEKWKKQLYKPEHDRGSEQFDPELSDMVFDVSAA